MAALVSVMQFPGDIRRGYVGFFDFVQWDIQPANQINDELENATPIYYYENKEEPPRIACALQYDTRLSLPYFAAEFAPAYIKVQMCCNPDLYNFMAHNNYPTVAEVWGDVPAEVQAKLDAYEYERQQQQLRRIHAQMMQTQNASRTFNTTSGAAAGAYDINHFFPIDDDDTGLDPRYFPGGRAEGRYKPMEPPPQEVLDLFP